MDLINAINKRKSIRKFKDESVNQEDLETILKAALKAPSAMNMQNWHYVVIQDQDKIESIAQVIRKKQEKICKDSENQELADKFSSKIRYYTFFEKAPVLILVYASKYNSSTGQLLSGKDKELFEQASPGMQNIGASFQNLLLAATRLGYGTCWMTGPNFAIKDIESFIGLDKPGYHLVAMTPLGVPADQKHPSPGKEGLERKVSFI